MNVINHGSFFEGANWPILIVGISTLHYYFQDTRDLQKGSS